MDVSEGTAEASEGAQGKQIRLKFAGQCITCGIELSRNTQAVYFCEAKAVRCVVCPLPAQEHATPPVQNKTIAGGDAGAGAQLEYEKRRARHEEKVRKKYAWLGKVGSTLAVKLGEEPSSAAAYRKGADGEKRVGRRLDIIAEQVGGVALHDRKIPGSRANIDHILISPFGVWVVDAKKYAGPVRRRVSGGLLSPRTEILTVNGRDRSTLVHGVIAQAERIQAATGVKAGGVLCFSDGDLPFPGDFQVDGVHIMWPKRIKRLTSTDRGLYVVVEDVATAVSEAFPPYVSP